MLADFRFALRLLTKNRGTAISAIVALGFGIGLATVIFNAFSAVMLRPFPYIADEHRVVYINSQPLNHPDDLYELSLPDFLDLRAQVTTLEGFTTALSRTVIVAGADQPERVMGASISVEGFPMLGVQPVLGRPFIPADAEASASPVAIISHALWQRRYGGDIDIIGRIETLNGEPTTIVGVMPAGFNFPSNHEMWTPYRFDPKPEERGSHYLPGYARLKAGASLDEARAEVAAVGKRLAHAYPSTNDGKGFYVRSIREEATENEGLLMRLMLGAAFFVLLIACANVANLLLAKSASRTHEIAIRVSVGATRGRIIRQVMTESVVLAVIGGLCGLLFAVWGNSLVIHAVPEVRVPFWISFDFDWRVFAFAATAAVGSAFIFGLFPALQASRSTALELREGARSMAGGSRSRRVRQGLVIAQVALSAVLLIGAGLFVRSFLKLQSTPPGYDPEGVLTFRVGLPPTQYEDKAVIRRFFHDASARLEEVPGVQSVGATALLPGDGNNSNAVLIEGHQPPRSISESVQVTSHYISRGYLSTLSIPLLRGRQFSTEDTADSPKVALIDQRFAERMFPDEDPIGRRLTFDAFNPSGEFTWYTIIGIVGNVPQQLDRPYERGAVYRAQEQHDLNFMSYAVRVRGDPASFGPAMQAAILAANPDIPIYNVRTLQNVYDVAYWTRRFFSQVFGVFGLGSLFLAALGVYSVMAYNVTQRTPEIGVRMALGATTGDVLRLVSRQGLILVGSGLVIGLVAALTLTRFMAALLYEISPSDPPTYFVLTTVLALVGLLASYLPARRATRVDPLTALRAE
jgi:putative ABC transport system permease protein